MHADARHEIKMNVGAEDHARVLALLLEDPFGFRRPYPNRVVQSLYFDTEFGRALGENLAGVSRREKLRLRWYGADSEKVEATLEKKVRLNMLGWKETWPLTGRVTVRGEMKRDLMPRVRNALPAEVWHELNEGVQPVQWIRYERSYFASGALRVTVDRGLESFELRWRCDVRDDFSMPLPAVVVIEAKGPRSEGPRLEAFLARFPVRKDRFSKFVLASKPSEVQVPARLRPFNCRR